MQCFTKTLNLLYPHMWTGISSLKIDSLRFWHRLQSIAKNTNRCRAWIEASSALKSSKSMTPRKVRTTKGQMTARVQTWSYWNICLSPQSFCFNFFATSIETPTVPRCPGSCRPDFINSLNVGTYISTCFLVYNPWFHTTFARQVG